MMLSQIENYYKELGLNPFLLKKKLSKLEKHPDIAAEFASWIDSREFKKENCVEVNGYTAASLAQKCEILKGEAAFMLLIELRDDPVKAAVRISEGFHIL
jgi:hypothetical protein